MPFTLKSTLLFNGPRHGASESLYFQQNALDIDGAFTFLADTVSKRAALLGKTWEITGHRIMVVRDTLGNHVVRQGDIKKMFVPGTQTQEADETGNSLQAQMADSFKKYKKLCFLCGPWRAIFPHDNTFDPNGGPGFQTLFDAWGLSLITKQMGWLRQVVANQARITNYLMNPTTGIVTITLANPGIPWFAIGKPQSVRIDIPLRRSPLDGNHVVIPVDAVTCTTAQPIGVQPFTVQGTLSTFDKVFVNLADQNNRGQTGTVTAQNPVSRKRGRPSLASRGRAPVRVQW